MAPNWANPAVSYIDVLSAPEERLVKMRDAGYSIDQCADALAVRPLFGRTRECARREIVAAEISARKRILRFA
jgi:hypothetical protein